MSIFEDFDPNSAWLEDLDLLTLDELLEESARQEFLRAVDAVAARDEDVADPSPDEVELPGVSPPDELAFESRPALPAEALAAMAPDGELLAELEAVDVTEVDEYYLVEMAAAFQRLSSWATAQLTRIAGELAGRPLMNGRGALPSHVDAGNMAADELAPRLGLSRQAARRIVRNARHFAGTFAVTGHALATGQIDPVKASTIVSMLEGYPAEIAVLVQDAVIDDADLQTHSQLVRAIRKSVIAVSHDDADWLHAKARAKRRVDHPRELADGMASILAILPATDAVALDLALEAAARTARANGDGRTLDQLRADILALMGHAALETGYVGLPPGSVVGSGDAPSESRRPAASPRTHADAPVAGAESTAQPGQPDAPPTPPPTPVPAAPSGPAGPGETHAPSTGSTRTGTPSTRFTETRAPSTRPTETDAARGLPEELATASRPERTTAPTGAQGPGARADHPGQPAGHDDTDAPGTADDTGRPSPDAGSSRPRRWHMPVGQLGGRRTQMHVTVPLSVLLPPDIARQLGLPATKNDDGTGAELSPMPAADAVVEFLEREPAEVAELEGYGPISPAVARAAALGGTWRRLVTDPLTGIVLDHGRTRYRPPADLAQLIRLRDTTCVRPGCSSPARVCQLDHVIPWSAGGTTSLLNLADLCTRDHILKTSGAFHSRHLGAGDFEWTTPTGHVYRRYRSGRVARVERPAFAEAPPF